MTEGTSQGLFIVVAIVIFGIFVSLSYTLFGSQSLTNDLKGLFINTTEQAINDLNKSNSNLIDNGDFDKPLEDSDFKNIRLRGYANGVVSDYVYLSEKVTYKGNKSLEIMLYPESLAEGGKQDVTFSFSSSNLNDLDVGSSLTVSYMVKGDDLVLSTRMGVTGLVLPEHIQKTKVSDEWTKVVQTFKKRSNAGRGIEYILYSAKGGKINIANFKIEKGEKATPF